jgi:hypothetical protein
MASLKELMKQADELGIDYTELTKDELVEAIAEAGGGGTPTEAPKEEEKKVAKPKAKKAAKKAPEKKAKAPAPKKEKKVAPVLSGENPFREGSESYKIAAWIMKYKDPEKVIEKIAEDTDISLGNRTKKDDRLAYARVRFYDVRYYLQVKLAEQE